jgi:tRNA A37 threonylcarbamoyltransferase TsaD
MTDDKLLSQQLDDILLDLNHESRKVVSTLIFRYTSLKSIKILKNWIANLNEECKFDGILTNLICEIIYNMTKEMTDDIKLKEEQELAYTGKFANEVVITVLQKIIEELEKYNKNDVLCTDNQTVN